MPTHLGQENRGNALVEINIKNYGILKTLQMVRYLSKL
jgi:hypothetical protein